MFEGAFFITICIATAANNWVQNILVISLTTDNMIYGYSLMHGNNSTYDRVIFNYVYVPTVCTTNFSLNKMLKTKAQHNYLAFYFWRFLYYRKNGYEIF